eukprot:scaffold39802_cov64-Phaeocystis_antarctica.AAC.1
MTGEVGRATRVDHQPTTKGGQPPRDIKTDQFGRATGLDIDDAAQSLGVEHDAPGHLRLDGDGAVPAFSTILSTASSSSAVMSSLGLIANRDPGCSGGEGGEGKGEGGPGGSGGGGGSEEGDIGKGGEGGSGGLNGCGGKGDDDDAS